MSDETADLVSETKKVEVNFLVNINQSRMLSSGFMAEMCGPSILFRLKVKRRLPNCRHL